jgi:non-heme chloroperoxidase
MPYVTAADETELYVKEWGPSDGRPVILIHGWPLNADSWDDVALGLANAGFRAIAYDRRGFGRSDQPWEGYNYDTLADDLAAVIEQCDADDAAIVGFSMGGGEVARYLLKHGTGSVRQAALISSVVPFMLKTDDNPHGVDPSVFDGMTEGMKDDRAAFMQTFAKGFFGVGFLTSPVSDAVLDAFFQSAMMAGLHPTLACAKAFAMTDFRADTAAFTIPTLIIHGTSDQTVPIDSSAREAAKLISHARLVEYDGAPHGVLVTHKADVLRDLLAFLNGEEVVADQEIPRIDRIDPTISGLQPVY